MRLLLDTNVLVAAQIARGACSDVLEHSVRQHEVVSSQSMTRRRVERVAVRADAVLLVDVGRLTAMGERAEPDN